MLVVAGGGWVLTKRLFVKLTSSLGDLDLSLQHVQPSSPAPILVILSTVILLLLVLFPHRIIVFRISVEEAE